MLIAALGVVVSVAFLLTVCVVCLQVDRDEWRTAYRDLERRVNQRAADLEGLANLRPLGNAHRLPREGAVTATDTETTK